MPFPRILSLKVNVIALAELKLAYYNVMSQSSSLTTPPWDYFPFVALMGCMILKVLLINIWKSSKSLFYGIESKSLWDFWAVFGDGVIQINLWRGQFFQIAQSSPFQSNWSIFKQDFRIEKNLSFLLMNST